MKRLMLSAIAGLAFLALMQPAQAACNLCACLASTQAVNFGIYSALVSLPGTGTGEVGITCTTAALSNQTLAYDIKLSAGNGSIADRSMMFGASNRLHYNLYTASNYAIVWGDGTGSSQIVSGGGTVAVGQVFANAHTIHARLPAAQNVPGGVYTDLITVTVTY